jgi:two-component system, cell cycle sensor histidine kinase and response regulator CckA
MSEAIHILMLEDRPADAQLAMRELQREAVAFTAKRVWTEADFLAELRNHAPDLILADYSLPSYDGLSALKLAQQECPEIPFLFLSGSLGEERAIDALHHGATDYVLKQRLTRLGPAVRRALREVKERRERQAAEQRRGEAETRFRVLFELSPDGIVIINPETAGFLEFNEAAHRQLGYSREEFARLTIPDLEAAETPEETRARIAKVVRVGADDFDTRQRTKQGEIRDVHVTAQFVKVLGQGVYYCIWRDITEKKKLEAQSLRNQRIESVGRLTSGIAHDLNNILAPILMCAPLLREALHDPASLKIVDIVETGALRGAGIIKQLLTFGRGTAGERVPVQLLALVRDMANIIRETFPKNITARRQAPPEVWLVSGDATQLHQVLMNLCVNARDAMPTGGTLTLELENVQVDEALAQVNPGANPGRHVVLSVTDTGTGIPPENLDKVFDPFFTTKALGEGTGLGLSTVIGIVKSHRGFITINTKVDRGTQFRVYLPAAEATPDAGPAPDPESVPRGQGELVLVVDDEESLRGVARKILERHGYRVLEAMDGTSGLTQYTQHQAEIQLVMTDLAMPFMDGPALIRALHQTNPQVRIVAMSGHQSFSKRPKQLTEPVQGFLTKPFNSASLLHAVWGALHAATPGQAEAPKSSP